MRDFQAGLADAHARNRALGTPPHRRRKLCSRRRLWHLWTLHCPKFPLTGFNRIFGTGCARPHLSHENENGGCPNSCRSPHFFASQFVSSGCSNSTISDEPLKRMWVARKKGVVPPPAVSNYLFTRHPPR